MTKLPFCVLSDPFSALFIYSFYKYAGHHAVSALKKVTAQEEYEFTIR